MLRIYKRSAIVPVMQGLTDRQQQILDYITEWILERGYPPTIREIGQHMGIRSTNGVNDHLKALERKGYLHREGLKSRALRPTNMPKMVRGAKSRCYRKANISLAQCDQGAWGFETWVRA